MDISLSKKTILYLLVFAWVVFSIIYIINNIWSDFKNVQILNAYEQGRVETINQLIQEVEKCQPVSVFSAGKEIQLINIDCLEEQGIKENQ